MRITAEIKSRHYPYPSGYPVLQPGVGEGQIVIVKPPGYQERSGNRNYSPRGSDPDALYQFTFDERSGWQKWFDRVKLSLSCRIPGWREEGSRYAIGYKYTENHHGDMIMIEGTTYWILPDLEQERGEKITLVSAKLDIPFKTGVELLLPYHPWTNINP